MPPRRAGASRGPTRRPPPAPRRRRDLRDRALAFDLEKRHRGPLHDAARAVLERRGERKHRRRIENRTEGDRGLPPDVRARVLEERPKRARVAPGLDRPQRVRGVHANAPRRIDEERDQPRGCGGIPDVSERARGGVAHDLHLVGRELAERGSALAISDPAERVCHAPAHLGTRVLRRGRKGLHERGIPRARGGQRRGPPLRRVGRPHRSRERGAGRSGAEHPERRHDRFPNGGIDLRPEAEEESGRRRGVSHEADGEGRLAADDRRLVVERLGKGGSAARILDAPQGDRRGGADFRRSVLEQEDREAGRVARALALGDRVPILEERRRSRSRFRRLAPCGGRCQEHQERQRGDHAVAHRSSISSGSAASSTWEGSIDSRERSAARTLRTQRPTGDHSAGSDQP